MTFEDLYSKINFEEVKDDAGNTNISASLDLKLQTPVRPGTTYTEAVAAAKKQLALKLYNELILDVVREANNVIHEFDKVSFRPGTNCDLAKLQELRTHAVAFKEKYTPNIFSESLDSADKTDT